MLPLHLEKQTEFAPAAPLPPEAFAYLNHLRFTAMQCRAKPRADLFEACALLHVTRGATRTAYAEALMRCLPEALGKPARLHAPGVQELSFDESWLVRLGIASADKDYASLTFLLQSRVARQNRRLIRFLIAQIADSLFSI